MEFGGERLYEDAEAIDENRGEAEEESEGRGENYVPAEEEFFWLGGHYLLGGDARGVYIIVGMELIGEFGGNHI